MGDSERCSGHWLKARCRKRYRLRANACIRNATSSPSCTPASCQSAISGRRAWRGTPLAASTADKQACILSNLQRKDLRRRRGSRPQARRTAPAAKHAQHLSRHSACKSITPVHPLHRHQPCTALPTCWQEGKLHGAAHQCMQVQEMDACACLCGRGRLHGRQRQPRGVPCLRGRQRRVPAARLLDSYNVTREH